MQVQKWSHFPHFLTRKLRVSAVPLHLERSGYDALLSDLVLSRDIRDLRMGRHKQQTGICLEVGAGIQIAEPPTLETDPKMCETVPFPCEQEELKSSCLELMRFL